MNLTIDHEMKDTASIVVQGGIGTGAGLYGFFQSFHVDFQPYLAEVWTIQVEHINLVLSLLSGIGAVGCAGITFFLLLYKWKNRANLIKKD